MFLHNPLFDLNGNGKLEVDEEFLEFMVMTECLKPEPETVCNTSFAIGDNAEKPGGDVQADDTYEQNNSSWREAYYGNSADVDPDKYESLEDFLWVYESVCQAMRESFAKLAHAQLIELNKKYDLRLCGAIVYMGFQQGLNEKQSEIAIEELIKQISPYNITREKLQSVANQLQVAIEGLKSVPDAKIKFVIEL